VNAMSLYSLPPISLEFPFVQTSKRQRTDKDAEIEALRNENQALREEIKALKDA